jgi:hypothetical protein
LVAAPATAVARTNANIIAQSISAPNAFISGSLLPL